MGKGSVKRASGGGGRSDMLREKASKRFEDAVVSHPDVVNLLKTGHGPTGTPAQEVLDMATSIELFTSHNVNTVRDPSLFLSYSAKPIVIDWRTSSRNPDGSIRYVSHSTVKNTKSKYEMANKIITRLASTDRKDSITPEDLKVPHFRGVTLPLENVTKLQLEDAKGKVVPSLSGKILSFSKDKDQAIGFAVNPVLSGSVKNVPVLLQLFNGLKRGTHIARQSRIRSEEETLSSGGFKLINFVTKLSTPISGGVYVFNVEQI